MASSARGRMSSASGPSLSVAQMQRTVVDESLFGDVRCCARSHMRAHRHTATSIAVISYNLCVCLCTCRARPVQTAADRLRKAKMKTGVLAAAGAAATGAVRGDSSHSGMGSALRTRSAAAAGRSRVGVVPSSPAAPAIISMSELTTIAVCAAPGALRASAGVARHRHAHDLVVSFMANALCVQDVAGLRETHGAPTSKAADASKTARD
ncbi:hypothetical protein EON67_04820, partial [archaeon]